MTLCARPPISLAHRLGSAVALCGALLSFAGGCSLNLQAPTNFRKTNYDKAPEIDQMGTQCEERIQKAIDDAQDAHDLSVGLTLTSGIVGAVGAAIAIGLSSAEAIDKDRMSSAADAEEETSTLNVAGTVAAASVGFVGGVTSLLLGKFTGPESFLKKHAKAQGFHKQAVGAWMVDPTVSSGPVFNTIKDNLHNCNVAFEEQ